MERINKEILICIFEKIRNIMIEKKDELLTLDSEIGDGDLGITMSEGFSKVCENIPTLESEVKLGNFLMKSGFTMANAVPSTMGTLIATAIMKSGTDLREKEYVETVDVPNMFKYAINAIEKRGKAKRGEKTILDALYPAMEEAIKAVDEKKDFVVLAKNAYEGAKNGLEDTKSMKSVHGKAACFGEKTLGKQDPGATVVTYIMEAIYDCLKNADI